MEGKNIRKSEFFDLDYSESKLLVTGIFDEMRQIPKNFRNFLRVPLTST